MGTDALIQKLEQFIQLTEEDKRLLRNAVRDVRVFDRREDIIHEGDRPENVHLVMKGWAARYKSLPNGDQPILAFLIPGDLCDVHVALLDEMDHSLKALSPCRIALLPRDAIQTMLKQSERLTRALWWATLLDEAILREWLVTTGHRPANQRLGHLICEMLLRMRAVGLSKDDSFELPLTQDELGDVMGISSVHTNRMIQELRGEGLITTEGKRMVVNDLDRLMEFAEFDPNYLHQVNKRARLARVNAS
ncbi:Crp/Fnr family transcriptional regulator [Rubellimicrobium rubrum]|uniref:Crp/Fnr family transcriptional regulator n=1 Tax=Rubellimicrobium rubrum TaxID=2585369 RepID=A0A5C4MUC4_9RHOB|nr:Crp/Fnr family transcriptional regulator [Rubellimicrobium rubrum]TNC48553.1 Crp/Fnr family transcriptional regulator [Rubellimicrobium rubrum]